MIITREREGVRLVAFRKSANATIVNSFCTNRGEDVVRGGKTMRYPDKHAASVTVAFFRNPLARLVSAYNHLVRGDEGLHDSLHKWGYKHGMEFDYFIDLTLAIPDKEIDLHLRSQVRQLADALEEHHTEIVWIGQVEQLATSSWREMRDVTGLQTPDFVPAFNARGHPPWPTYYTPTLAAKVFKARCFSGDYEVWQSRMWR